MLEIGVLLLAQAEVGHGGDRAGELPRGGLRRAAHESGGKLPEPGQGPQALDHVGLGREQLLAAQAEPVDQPVDIAVGAAAVDRGQACPVEL